MEEETKRTSSPERLNRHDGVISRLKNSRPALFKVAEWLHAHGYSVRIPKIEYAPKDANPMDYVDDGDIFIKHSESAYEMRCEVKHRFVDFTSKEDWKYPDAIVSNRKAVERSKGTVFAYIMVNQNMTHMFYIKGNSNDAWFTKKVKSKNTGLMEEFYFCPIKLAQFRSLSYDQ